MLINVYVVSPDPDPDPNPRGSGQLPNPNECNSTLTSGTSGIYPHCYILMLMSRVTAQERSHRLRIRHTLRRPCFKALCLSPNVASYVLHTNRLHPNSMEISYPTYVTEPDKLLPSLTFSYRPISFMSSIMKQFERVIEQRRRSYLEDIGFISKYQSSFRQNKCTNDHLFRLSQSVIESFDRREHVVAAFLDIKKLLTMFGTID